MKIDRIIAIVFVLLERKKIHANDLAQMFDVSTRTIYRDIETITLAGIPVITYSGHNGGISILEEYKVSHGIFSTEDIISLILGLQSLPESLSSTRILSTVAKVKQLIPDKRYQKIESSLQHISIDMSPWSMYQPTTTIFDTLHLAIQNHQEITFDYIARNNEYTNRHIEPYQLFFKEDSWYLQGYCLFRQDFRTFKLSRIEHLEVLSNYFISREFISNTFDGSWMKGKIFPITLHIHPSIKHKLLSRVDSSALETIDDSHIKVTFPFADDEFGYQLLLSYGDACKVIEPEFVKEKLKQKLQTMLAYYT